MCVYKPACVRKWQSRTAGWLQWFRRPVLAAALTVIMGIGIGVFFTRSSGYKHSRTPQSSILPGARLATCKRSKKITTCIRILSCSMTSMCSKMLWQIRR